MYPPKMNIIRHSKDISKPTIQVMKYQEAKEKVGCPEPTFKNCKLVVDGEYPNIVNTIIYEQYNILRSNRLYNLEQ